MHLIGLDENYNNVAYINYTNLQWKRRYYETGSWTAQILEADYDPRIKYVYTPDRPEFGLVQRVETQQNIKGRFVLISGLFIECIFNRQIAFPHITGTFNLKELVRQYTQRSWYKPDKYALIADPNNPDDQGVEVKWERGYIGDYVNETLKTLEYSHRIVFDPVEHTFTYRIWRGLDRTQSQTENAYVMFSEESCYVTDFKYIEDESNYKNIAMVLYGEQPSRHDVYTENCEEEGRRWVLLNASDDDTKEARTTFAQEELKNYPFVREAEIEVIQNGLFYLTDYDLGDKCDIVFHRLQKQFEARITGVDEVFKNGMHEVTLQFGEQSQTVYQRMKHMMESEKKALGLTNGLNNGGSWTE